MASIRITIGDLELAAELLDTPTAQALQRVLPVHGSVNTWGDEIYFGIPVNAEPEPGASAVVKLGDIAYWPPGSAFCIFFGRTPASSADEIRAASVVNPLGKLTEVPVAKLRSIRAGTRITIEELKD